MTETPPNLYFNRHIKISNRKVRQTEQELYLSLCPIHSHEAYRQSLASVLINTINDKIVLLFTSPEQMNRQNSKYNFGWHDNNYEPGLFTFYREANSLEPKRDHPHNGRSYKQKNMRRNSKSEIKLDNSRKYITQYLDKNLRKTTPKLPETKQYSPANIREIKFIKTPPKNPSHHHKSISKPPETESAKHMRIAMKNNNMSSYFKYDINKTRKNMFIFRGDCTKLYLRFNNSEARVPLLGEDSRKYAHDQPRDNQTQRSRRVETISYSQAQSTNSKPRTNILQFLLDRRKKAITHKQAEVSPLSTVDLTLGKFTRYKKPNLSELSSFLKN